MDRVGHHNAKFTSDRFRILKYKPLVSAWVGRVNFYKGVREFAEYAPALSGKIEKQVFFEYKFSCFPAAVA